MRTPDINAAVARGERIFRALHGERADRTGGLLLNDGHGCSTPLLELGVGEVADGGGKARLTSGPGTVTPSGTTATLAPVSGGGARGQSPRRECRNGA